MLLRILRPIVRLTLWIFYRRIYVHGRDRIPTDRPLILVANHPNVMIDTLIVGIHAPGELPRYLGKSTLFSRPLYAWFLKRLGVIAVSRSEDPGAPIIRNRDMLRTVCQTLREGHSMIVFPEGASHPELRLRELKPGTARIALRVEAEAEGRAGVLVVPVGLTYSDPGTFRSDAYVHFGEGIEVAEYLEAYRQNHEEAEDALTGLIRERLLTLVRHVEKRELESLIREVSAIYGSRVEAELAGSEGINTRLRAEQEIIRAVHHFTESDPELVHSIERRVRSHLRILKRLGLDTGSVSGEGRFAHLGRVLLALLLSPLALYGFLHNALPYYVPRLLAWPYRETPEILGTVKMAAGVVCFPLAYMILTCGAFLVTEPRYVLPYALSLPTGGLFALFYTERVLRNWPIRRSLFLTRRGRRYLERLSEEQAGIRRDIDVLRERYLALPS